ncbi:MAG: putative N-acetylmannosamine-6-phosphate 2-epimerase [bacterium]|nr:putative N-acetylmannosamine-6-phosphate 2-epimerase [bacterium]
MKTIPSVCLRFQGKLLVSCQAPEGDVFRDPASMARFARAAVEGGAAGIRANGAVDVRAIREAVSVPIIGIHKAVQPDGKILITPSFEAARELAGSGADIIALDCSRRGLRHGALERLRRIRSELNIPVAADIATIQEAVRADAAGADLVLSTMRGYTEETAHVASFDPSFIAELVRSVDAPVIAEGRVETPGQAREALAAGAFAVVVGGAITRPRLIAQHFAAVLEEQRTARETRHFIAIDLGATRTKYGIVSSAGELLCASSSDPPAHGGRESLLAHLKRAAACSRDLCAGRGITPSAIGVATAGWVDPAAGSVVYATDNLPGWTGARIGGELGAATGLPVAVENDANALALGEKYFGAAKGFDDFVCITLGTGVGGGCYVSGRLNRGAHFLANGLGHIVVEPGGLPCTCGQRGCLEAYANAAALLRYAGEGAFSSAEELILAANAGDATALAAVSRLAVYLARGCAIIVHLLDPEALILSGGIAQDNAGLLACLEQKLSALVPIWKLRRLRIALSPLGYYGGVIGAAAAAIAAGI